MPKLEKNDYSWTEQANILFIDRCFFFEIMMMTSVPSPVGVGWSYTEGVEGFSNSYQVNHNHHHPIKDLTIITIATMYH